MKRVFTVFKTILPAIAGCSIGFAAYAGPLNIVQNGGFENTNMTLWCSAGTDCADQMTTTNVSDWTTTGYNFVYTPQSTRTSGQYTGDPLAYQTGGGLVGLYNATAPNTYTGGYNTIFNSPAGGNIVAADGAYQTQNISQTLNGLEKGGDYAITFWYAGAQQDGFTGANSEAFKVSLGTESFETPVLQNASHGFTGWYQQTFIFEATGTSEVLSFFAIGTPSGQPPFTLLDGVTGYEVPEPGTLAMFGCGIAGLGLLARKKRANAA